MTIKMHQRPIGFRADGRPVLLIGGGSEPDVTTPPADPPAPDSTPEPEVKDWQAEAEKWKALSRKNEDKAKANAAAVKERDELKAATATEAEKALAAARAEVLKETAPRLVRAEFRAAAKGVLTNTQRDALLEDLDLNRYLTDGGDVDEEKVAKKIKAVAPTQGTVFPGLGQQSPGTSSKPSVARGAQMYRDRHTPSSAASTGGGG